MRARRIFPVDELPLIGGRLCLDFANTANRLEGRACDERFETYEDLVRWSERLGLVDPSTARALVRSGKERPASVRAAHELRQCLWDVFSEKPKSRALRALESASRGVLRLKRTAGGVALDPGEEPIAWLLRAVAASAIELLTGPGRREVKTCPGDRCGWLFLDDGAGRRRKWCSMRTCGNRHKARGHYERARG